MRRLVKRVLQSCGWELRRRPTSRSEEDVLTAFLAAVRPDAVLDVGANTGQFAALIGRAGYSGTIISFEAIPDVHEILSRNARQNRNWIVAPCAALGSKRDTLDINVSENTLSSSLLPMRELHSSAAPESRYIARRQVEVRRLDEIAKPLIPEHATLLLKIDTQGYEREVIDGASGILDQVFGIQVELSLAPLYTGAPTFIEMTGLIEALGFDFFGITPVFHDPRTGRLLQVDGYFTRGNKHQGVA